MQETVPGKGPRAVVEGYDPDDELWEYINSDGTPDETMLRRVVESIVENADPERVILFGSAARGEMHQDSDVDLLVVQAGCKNGLERAGKLCGALPEDRRSVDIVLMSPEEFELNRGRPCFVVEQALAEGRTVYERRRHV